MTLDWLYRLSDWNPQFFREIKGRLKPRNLTFAIAASLLTQLTVLLYFWALLPHNATTYSNYCVSSKVDSYSSWMQCTKDALGNPIINWQHWWLDLSQVLSWGLPLILLMGGVYQLVNDLGKEERRGTLNFIRLTPQTSRNILLGKLLGVPAIPYVVVAAALPLHLITAIAGGLSTAEILSIYLVTVAACCCFYTGSLLYSLLGGFQGWAAAVIVGISYLLCLQMWMASQHWNNRFLGFGQWFGLPIGTELGFAVGFIIITSGVTTYWLWTGANRRFRNPNATLLNKRQGYLATACFEIGLVGFAFRDVDSWYHPLNDFAFMMICNLMWFLVMIAALTPQRQTLLDWTRYRRERVSHAKRFWNYSVVSELLWGEKSPAVVAIALNLLIAVAVFTPWALTWPKSEHKFSALFTLLFGITFMLICAVVVQLMLLMQSPKRAIWATGAVGALVFLPLVILGILGGYSSVTKIGWLFSAFAFVALQSTSLTTTTIFLSFLSHLGCLSLLTLRLSHQLKKVGESEFKALLAASKA